jgi:opacity protein-like surface antigen
MKRSVIVISAALVIAFTAAATDEPSRYEAYLGFQYVRANEFNQNFGLGEQIGGFSMYGGDGQFIYNFSHWISGVVDAGGVNKPNVGIINAANTTAFVYGGPRFSFRKHLWGLAPFGEVLFGAAFRHVSTEVTALTGPDTPSIPIAYPSNLFPGPLAVVTARLADTENAFSMKVGGGVDYKLSKHFSLRPLEVDYVLTRFPSLTEGTRQNQSSIAASAGVIFTFGAL